MFKYPNLIWDKSIRPYRWFFCQHHKNSAIWVNSVTSVRHFSMNQCHCSYFSMTFTQIKTKTNLHNYWWPSTEIFFLSPSQTGNSPWVSDLLWGLQLSWAWSSSVRTLTSRIHSQFLAPHLRQCPCHHWRTLRATIRVRHAHTLTIHHFVALGIVFLFLALALFYARAHVDTPTYYYFYKFSSVASCIKTRIVVVLSIFTPISWQTLCYFV